MASQLDLFWEQASVLAETDTLQAREAPDADIAQADQERDDALAREAQLEKSELAVVVAEHDRLIMVRSGPVSGESTHLQGECLRVS